jgi:hypothetical protein
LRGDHVPDPYYFGAEARVLSTETLPNGNECSRVVYHNNYAGDFAVKVEVTENDAPACVATKVTDAFGQVVTYRWVLERDRRHTTVTLSEELLVESSASPSLLAWQWETDRQEQKWLARSLGDLRHRIERQRRPSA